ncbi:Leucine-rich repeat [Sesbania bispinosa]|nr:Leucine-rich repeat [Sesbania bispinosa]
MATKLLFLLLILLFHVSSSLSELCHPDDKRTLLQIKKELNNPTLLSSWKPNTDCCNSSWYSVECYSSNNNRVGFLAIENNDLTAQFPPSTGNLPYLETLIIYQLPNLTGSIPHSLSKLTNLKSLTIASTGVSGPIPNFITKMNSLHHIDLSDNKLSGTLPPSLYKLPNLSVIVLNNNKLTGPIPASYGYFRNRNLYGLYLSHNQLSGRLPVTLARLKPSIIDLSHNRFEGDASMLFGSNKEIETMDISWNSFAFDLGRVELPKTLQRLLDVSHNKIYGKVPVGVQNLQYLNVSYNRLCGEIPKGLWFSVDSYIHNKCLCGSPLPSCK